MSKQATSTFAPSVPEKPAQFSHKQERFLSLRDVLERLTIGRTLLYELIRDPVLPFPSPVHIGRRSVWVEREVEAYMRDVVESQRRDVH